AVVFREGSTRAADRLAFVICTNSTLIGSGGRFSLSCRMPPVAGAIMRSNEDFASYQRARGAMSPTSRWSFASAWPRRALAMMASTRTSRKSRAASRTAIMAAWPDAKAPTVLSTTRCARGTISLSRASQRVRAAITASRAEATAPRIMRCMASSSALAMTRIARASTTPAPRRSRQIGRVTPTMSVNTASGVWYAGPARTSAIGVYIDSIASISAPARARSARASASSGRCVRSSNNDVGGRVVEWTGREYMVRGRGYIQNVTDVEQIALGAKADGTPVQVKDVARVHLGPDMRRGVADLDGKGDAAGGIVVVRQGVDTYRVIQDVKKAIRDKVQPALPEGVKVVTTYDRSNLIERSIETLKEKLVEEIAIVSLVCIVFLWHVRSALVAILTLPLSILLAFVAMHAIGLGSNIMSLGGIAIAIGAMVDAAIIMIENVHKHLEQGAQGKTRREILIEAAQQVGRPLFFSLLIITVSFLPIFSLEGQEGRLFRPLAFTKTFAMGFAAVTSVLIVPFLMIAFIRGKIAPEDKNPLNRALMRGYHPFVRFVLRHPVVMLAAAAALMAATVPVYLKLGSEFMPPLYEGTLLYMPSTLPGASIQTAQQLMQTQDKLIRQFPAAESVAGKAGRARHGGNGHQPQARSRMARRDDAGEAHRRARPGRAPAGRRQRVDDAHQGAHRHALDRHPHPHRRQGLRSRTREDWRHRRPDRDHARERAGHAQRLRRTRDARLLRGLHRQARPDRALRPERRRRRDGDRERRRGRERHHDRRGARALPGQRALPARLPRRPRVGAPHAHLDTGGGPDPHGGGGRHQGRDRTGGPAHRASAAPRLRLRRRRGPRHRRLRRRREGGGRQASGAAS